MSQCFLTNIINEQEGNKISIIKILQARGFFIDYYNDKHDGCYELICFKTGRLKSGYGVESIYRLLSGDCSYMEKHNGWYDAIDELKIMELLALPIEVYEIARI